MSEQYVADRFGLTPAEWEPIESAVRNWTELRDQIRNAGMPPHTDYWHQSIDAAWHDIAKAVAAVKRNARGAK